MSEKKQQAKGGLSQQCREQHHGFCSGSRRIGEGKGGRTEYSRCKCRCHG